MREDYQDYWSDREKDEEEGETPSGFFMNLTYRIGSKEKVLVHIDSFEAEFNYGNGANLRIPITELRFCPECLKKGDFPFVEDGECSIHNIHPLPFNLQDFERFRILGMLESTNYSH